MKPYYNEYLDQYRLSPVDMANLFFPGEHIGANKRAALKARALELGAWHIGKATVVLPNGQRVLKDSAYAVATDNWEAWCEAMRATPIPGGAKRARPTNWKPGTWAVFTVESHITTDPAEADAARRAGKIVRKLA